MMDTMVITDIADTASTGIGGQREEVTDDFTLPRLLYAGGE
jgi:hypothetical protein